MLPKIRNRLLKFTAIMIPIICGTIIILYNLSSNITFFITPSEFNKSKHNGVIKIGGYVADGSLQMLAVNHIRFTVTDFDKEIVAEYKGIIPTIFREGQGAVLTGKFNQENNCFVATELLAKHDEKYIPKTIDNKIKSNLIKN